MILEITCGADPTIVVRKQVTEETLIPITSAGLNLNFVPEEGDDPKLLEQKSRVNRKKNKVVEVKEVDPIGDLDKE